jgi:hypothetical protein
MSSSFHLELSRQVKLGVLKASGGRVEKKPRKPRKANEVIVSPFRPLVCASERLQLWHTPHTVEFLDTVRQEIPLRALLVLFQTILLSLDENTRSNYGSGLLRFNQFCDDLQIPESNRMPASAVLLSAFAASGAAKVSRSCVDSWLAGLRFWHIFNGAPWNGEGSEMLAKVKTGVQRLTPSSSKRIKRKPVTIEHMHALRDGLDLSTAFDSAVWACATAGFCGCCRLGELLIPSPNAFNPQKHVSRGTTTNFGHVRAGPEFVTFHIPWSKTTKEEGADITLTAVKSPVDPVSALRHHFSANTSVAVDAPLFAYETLDGTWAPMTKAWFMDRCREVWVAAGMDADLQGHGLRIGGATELLLQGVAPDVVATQGRWKSRAFLEYWRKIESVLPTFISRSFFVSRYSLIQESMLSFKKKYNAV